MPFDVADRDGVLTLTLDTPGSPINIFNHATAQQLIEILASVTPATTRAIVFETAKPNSFINGVGLLLAHAARTYEDTERASTPPWNAYRAVHDAPVPTIAVVHGNCFGCGVEFALNCDYRIATDSCETQFYMTELNDYLFIPLFGSTWNLPATVGLADAIDLLLWGERWGAEKARARGLVDEVVPHAQGGAQVRRFVRRALAGTPTSRRRGPVRWGAGEDDVMARTRQRIAALPPHYHEVYTNALQLLEEGARQTRTYVEHQQRELHYSAASALAPMGKAAYAFFYLRQMAGERAAGRIAGSEAPVRLSIEVDDTDEARTFATDLASRRFSGISGDSGVEPIRLVDTRRAAHAAAGPGHEVAVQVSIAAGPVPRATIYAPTYRYGGRLVELAIPPETTDLAADASTRLARTLQRCGFEVARTMPTECFVSDRLLMAYLAPLARLVELGSGVGAINTALRLAGFVRRPHDLLASFDRQQVALPLAASMQRTPAAVEPLLAALADDRYGEGAGDPVVLDALCISLLDAVLISRARREVRDPSIADLIARELLDFPRDLCSLCSWLKRDRVARALDADPRLPSLVSAAALDAARGFAAGGRELYR